MQCGIDFLMVLMVLITFFKPESDIMYLFGMKTSTSAFLMGIFNANQSPCLNQLNFW